MAILTPDERHALQASEHLIAATATHLAERWVAATVEAEDHVSVGAADPADPPTRTKRTIYRCAQSLPLTLSGLSPEQTSRAVSAAAALMTAAGWTVTVQRSVVTVVGIPTPRE